MDISNKGQQFSKTEPQKTPTPPSRPASSPGPASHQKTVLPQKPKTLFEEKKGWSRTELERRMKKASPVIPGTGGIIYSKQARKGILGERLEKLMPYNRFQGDISELEAKRRLRELRHQEYIEHNDAKKREISRKKRWLEEAWGLKGKY